MARYPRVILAFISLAVACFGLKLWANVNGTDVRANRTLFVNGAAPLVVPWSAPFADTNYTAVCTAELSGGSFLQPVITARSSGLMTIVPANNPDQAGILDCIAVPDSDQSDRRHGRTTFSGNPDTVTVMWNSPFADTNYTAACTVETADPHNVSFASVIISVAPGSVTVTNGGGGINAGTMHCLAVPNTDPGNVINHGSASVANNPPTVVVPWTTSFPDVGSYAAVCSDLAKGGATAIASLSGGKTPTQITVIPQLSLGSVDCVGGSGPLYATGLSLAISPSSPSAGQVVTLTATATSEFSIPSGTVVFLNGSQVLGTAQLVSGGGNLRRQRLRHGSQVPGTAQLKIRFGPGSYTLTALYTGSNPLFAPSQSVPQVISVSGEEPTQSTLTATPNGANYNLGLSVFGFGFPTLDGTGAVLNLTQHSQLVADISVGPGTTRLLPPQTADLGSIAPSQMVVADFNLDGFPDIAIADKSSNRVLVLLGNGDGTFQTPLITTVDLAPFGIAAGDFNDDGFPDLAVANDFSETITISLGNGDGTFRGGFSYFVGGCPNALTIGDFDSDGQLDLAVADACNDAVDVFFGEGTGQFVQLQEQALSVGTRPEGIVAADFNLDGFSDLAVVNNGSNTVSILLSNGDRTFQTALTVPTGSQPSGIAVADFNGDGIADLAISNQGSASLSILLGDSSGNFILHSSPAVGNSPIAVQVADLNGDGIADLIVANQGDKTVGVLLGNGDGTFQPQQTTALPLSASPFTLAMADFNGDSVPDPATADISGESGIGLATVFLGGTVSTGTANNVPVHGPGPQQLQANFTPVESVFAPSTSNKVTVTGSGLPSVTSLTSSLNPSVYLQTVTFTATVTADSQILPTGTVNFTADGSVICSGVLLVLGHISSTASCQVATLPAGNHSIIGSYSGDTNFAPSQSQVLVQVVTTAQSTTVLSASPPSPLIQGQVVTFTATVGPGSPTGTVTFTVDSAPIAGCTQVVLIQQQNGTIATCQTAALTIGSHTITAVYGGDHNFLPSAGSIPYVVRPQLVGDFTVQVSPAAVTVTQSFNNQNEPFYAQTITIAVQPTGGYQNTVTLSCSISPALTGGSCAVNPPTSGSLANGNLVTTLTISAGSTTPYGAYTVTITGQASDQLSHSAMLALTVIELTPPGTEPVGGVTRVMVNYPGTPGTPVGNFSCPAVMGTGIVGSEALSAIGGVCAFTPGSVNLPTPVLVTISGCTVARMQKHAPIYASFFFGMPVAVLLVSGSRKRILRAMGLLLLLTALLLGLGCGGYGPLTPTGHYYVLVQGTDAGGNTYSAVVPLTVNPLAQ